MNRQVTRTDDTGYDFLQTGKMKVRKLTEEDAAAWWRLRLEALRSDPMAFGTAAEEHEATTVETAAARIRELPGFTLGCFDGDELVATATFLRETGIRERHKGHIVGVYVAASHRGRKLGAKLLVALIELAREDSSLEQILLGVGTYNLPAIRTYRGLGFETYGTESRALKVASHYVDEQLMTLRLR